MTSLPSMKLPNLQLSLYKWALVGEGKTLNASLAPRGVTESPLKHDNTSSTSSLLQNDSGDTSDSGVKGMEGEGAWWFGNACIAV